jgi:hypothetical protein
MSTRHHEEQVLELTAYAKQVEAPEDVLDNLVHDAAQESRLLVLNTLADPDEQERHIEATEAMASEVNNGGVEEQLRFLLDEEVPPERIREELNKRPRNGSQTEKTPT